MRKLTYLILLFFPLLTFGQIPEPVSGKVSFETIQDTTYGVFAMIQDYDEPTAVWTWPGMVVKTYYLSYCEEVSFAYYLQIGRRYPMIEGVGEILYSMNIPRPIYKEIEESDFLMFKARK